MPTDLRSLSKTHEVMKNMHGQSMILWFLPRKEPVTTIRKKIKIKKHFFFLFVCVQRGSRFDLKSAYHGQISKFIDHAMTLGPLIMISLIFGVR